jgi:hypothetical protein
VHFTDKLGILMAILTSGSINPSGPFGWAKNIGEVAEFHVSGCFSEIPLDHLDRLMAQHGRFGIGFRRDFVMQRGGARVWYLDKGTALGDTLFAGVGLLLAQQDFTNPFWRLEPFIDSVVPGTHEFEWEREWRVPGGLRFNLDDVAFVILPQGDRVSFLQQVHIEAPVVSRDPPCD